MVITPTITLTGTYVLWVTGGGQDVGTAVFSLVQGLQVLSFLVAMFLGLYTGLRLLTL